MPSLHASWVEVRESLADALAIVLPVFCAGCAEPDTALCDDCARELVPSVTRRDLGGVPVWSGLSFEGVTARIIRAYKEEGRTHLARALAPALRAAAACAGPRLPVVPIPTSRASYRRRGYRAVDLVARRSGMEIAPLLRVSRQSGDQRGLSREDRRRNVEGSFLARRGGGPVLVADDVVTTGATLAEAAGALRRAGVDVVGAVTIASTPRHLDISWKAESHA